MPQMPEPVLKPHKPNQISQAQYSHVSNLSELEVSPEKQSMIIQETSKISSPSKHFQSR